MKKYVVGKRCFAVEYVFVEAENVVQARQKAKNAEDCFQASNALQFEKYRDNITWSVEELTKRQKEYSEEEDGL